MAKSIDTESPEWDQLNRESDEAEDFEEPEEETSDGRTIR